MTGIINITNARPKNIPFLILIFNFGKNTKADAKIAMSEYINVFSPNILNRYHFVAKIVDLSTKYRLSGFVTERARTVFPGDKYMNIKEATIPKKPDNII